MNQWNKQNKSSKINIFLIFFNYFNQNKANSTNKFYFRLIQSIFSSIFEILNFALQVYFNKFNRSKKIFNKKFCAVMQCPLSSFNTNY